jgi:hypothetical protein
MGGLFSIVGGFADFTRYFFLVRTMPATTLATVATAPQERSSKNKQAVFEVVIDALSQWGRRRFLVSCPGLS